MPPPSGECQEECTPIELSPADRITVRLWFWRGRTVDFAIMLEAFDDDVELWRDVARVDCCHGEVHRHEFARSGAERRVVIAPIPADDEEGAWDLLGREYDRAHKDLISGWDSYVQKWRQS